MNKLQVTFFVFLMFGASISPVFANNNLFLPGDAFFPTTLTLEDVENLNSAPESFRFTYSSYGGYAGAFCGYAGYDYAEVKMVNEKFAANLKTAYGLVRESEPRTFSEIELYDENGDDYDPPKIAKKESNGLRVMFYDKSFDLRRFKIGLRYNEEWSAEAVKFRHPRERLRLCCLVNHPKAIVASWRDASLVPALAATFPEVQDGEFAKSISTATITGKTKAVVTGSTPLSDYFSPKDGLSYMVIDEDGITRMTYENRKWAAEVL